MDVSVAVNVVKSVVWCPAMKNTVLRINTDLSVWCMFDEEGVLMCESVSGFFTAHQHIIGLHVAGRGDR